MQIAEFLRPRRALQYKKSLIAAATGAAAVAAAAAYVAWTAKRAEAKYPPPGRFLDVDKVRVHYLDRGEGPVILLLHGKGSMATDFEGAGIIDALARHHRVIAIDRPGFGYSARPRDRKWDATEQARLIAATLGHLAIGSATVVGHSFGALCAIALALEKPHMVERLVLLGGYYYPTKRPMAWENASALPVIGDFMNYTASAMAARMALGKLLRNKFSPQEVPAAFEEAVPKELLLRPSQMFAEADESLMLAQEAERLSARYGELTPPVILIAGDEDAALETSRQTQRLHEALPQSQIKIVEKTGHMLHYAAPQTVISVIEEAVKAGAKTRVTAPETPAG